MKKNYILNPKPYTLVIGWLYPELMSTYGDRGNIITLQKRCEWRSIKVEIVPIDQTTPNSQLSTLNLLFGGGAQDREQEIVMRDLHNKKETIKELIEKDIPALFVCGAPQLMGKYYEPAEGKRIEGLGIFDMESRHPGPNQERLIGNIVIRINDEGLMMKDSKPLTLVGFENHGGRTYLADKNLALGKVIKGFGNNGEDKTEGIIYKNSIGTYLHGPVLPKNPKLADFLIGKALGKKYGKRTKLKPLDDSLENKTRSVILAYR